MRILHLCLACFYIDGYNYQENILPRIDRENGNEVLVIASTETYVNNLELGYVEPGEYTTFDGIHVIRIPYENLISKTLTRKIRKYKGLYEQIEKFRPDVIMSHDLCFSSVTDVVKYKKHNPEIKFYADTHTASYNSGKSWISLYILHRLIYKYAIRRTIPYLEKYFYIGISEKKFSVKNYSVPESIMEYFPLGGVLLSETEYERFRQEKRRELGIAENELLFLHSGKLETRKRTEELISAFRQVKSLKAKMVVIGSIPEGRKSILEELLCGERIAYLGWKDADELKAYLCAADLYCQPGSVSATLQQAICCYCPVMGYPHEEYKHINGLYGNFIWIKTENDMKIVFQKIAENRLELDRYQESARRCAAELLDYEKLVEKYTKR